MEKTSNDAGVTEVLIVEDDLVTMRLHKYVVEKNWGKEVHIFSNGREAYNYLEAEANPEKKFFVLLDINMPQMNGWQFLEKVQKKFYASRLTVAIVSSSPTREDFRRAEELDLVKAYFQKPLKMENLRQFLD